MPVKFVDIECIVLMKTAAAILVDVGKKEHVWLPESQTEDNEDGTVTVPEWLAMEKGLI